MHDSRPGSDDGEPYENSGSLKDDDFKALLIGSRLSFGALLCNSVYYNIIVYIKSCSNDPMVTF